MSGVLSDATAALLGAVLGCLILMALGVPDVITNVTAGPVAAFSYSCMRWQRRGLP